MSKVNKFSKEEKLLIDSTLIIIPCYNMNSTIQSTVLDLKNYFEHILIIDDFSNEKVSDLSFPENVDIVRQEIHPVNQSKPNLYDHKINNFSFNKDSVLRNFDQAFDRVFIIEDTIDNASEILNRIDKLIK